MSKKLPAHRALSTMLALLAPLLATSAHAAGPGPAPVQLALWSPLQIIDSERSIRGFRYSLFWGVNEDVTGVDISTFSSETNGSLVGYQTALFLSTVDKDVTGVQTSLMNRVGGDVAGLQLAIFCSSTEGQVTGVQWGVLGCSTAREVTGVQTSGLANLTKSGQGVQIAALVNVAKDLKGLQLGLLNFNKSGFLPFFPIFNFGF